MSTLTGANTRLDADGLVMGELGVIDLGVCLGFDGLHVADVLVLVVLVVPGWHRRLVPSWLRVCSLHLGWPSCVVIVHFVMGIVFFGLGRCGQSLRAIWLVWDLGLAVNL